MIPAGLLEGDRRIVARCISAVEQDAPHAAELLAALAPHLGKAHVVGITGPPGAGKSTLIHALLGELVKREKRVAVVAVDPSSPLTGGAVLGDRVRMGVHGAHPNVFIRSVAARGHLGGLSRTTGGILDLLDAAGFDVVILETVGTGQSEVEILRVADTRVVASAPGAGDEVQALKAGILEIADVLVVTKADLPSASATVRDLKDMLHLRAATPKRLPVAVVAVSGSSGEGVSSLLDRIDEHRRAVGCGRRLAALAGPPAPPDTAAEAFAHLSALVAADPLLRSLGVRVERAGPGRLILQLEALAERNTTRDRKEGTRMTTAKPDGAYWNRAKETASRSAREAEVLGLLREQLLYVYENIPLYREHYDAAGFHPGQVETLADFTRRVPVITKQMLRDDQAKYPPFGSYLGKDVTDIARIHGSSGTSGVPTLYAISRSDWDYIADVMAQGLYTCGMRPSDRVQLATVYSLFIGGWGALLGTERLGATAFPVGAGETERQLELMYRIGSTVLITTPTYALHMLETAAGLGYDTVKSPLRLGIFIGEPGASIPGTRDALEKGWGIKVRDMATTSEMTPWSTNAECEVGNGMHVMQDEVWTEIVDKSDAAKMLPDGQSGAVIYSHLRRKSQPMIRFYSGDESHMIHEPCACGRTYPRLPAGVYGRLDDMLIIRGANIYPSQIQRALLTVPGVGVEFRIIVDRDGALDSVAVQVEHAPELGGDGHAAARDDLAQRVIRKLKGDTNINFQCTVVGHGTLERFVSKAKRVVDNRPKYRPANT